jgi:hypothetical protein
MPIIKDIHKSNDEEIAMLIEVDESSMPDEVDGERVVRSMTKTLDKAQELFGKGLKLARRSRFQTCSGAAQVVESIDDMDDKTRPDEYEMRIGIRLNSKVGAILVTAGAMLRCKSP